MENVSSDLAMWTALVAFIMPVLVAVVQKPKWKQQTRALVTAGVSIVVGGGTVYFTKPSLFDDGTAMTTVILTVLVGSTAAYNTFWKPLGIRKLEDATSPGDDTLQREEDVMTQLAESLGEGEIAVVVTGDKPAGGNILDRSPMPGAVGAIIPTDTDVRP